MSNSFFQFKQFSIQQDQCAMKVTTDACLFGSLLPNTFTERELINVLDIGTGTGLLALMYAQKNTAAIIDAVEIDELAANQAKENAQASAWKERINIIHADIKIFEFEKKYDLIISNPPFYENELKSRNSKKNMARHSEGLLLEELLNTIKTNLRPNGIFCLLLPFKRKAEINVFITKKELETLQIIFVRQSARHDYFRMVLTGRLKTNEPVKTEFEEISIWNERQEYTPEFVTLLKDYYFNL